MQNEYWNKYTEKCAITFLQVKIENSNSDVEIDIEDCDDKQKSTCNINTADSPKSQNGARVMYQKKESDEGTFNKKKISTSHIRALQLSDLSPEDLDIMTGMDVPTGECTMDENKITEIEKFVHREFFEGRSAKTPERYLMVRQV